MNARHELIIIVAPVGGVSSFHITTRGLRNTAGGGELWFPLPDDREESLFGAVERVLVVNKIAHNVSFINKIRQNNESSADYEVVYNVHQAGG